MLRIFLILCLVSHVGIAFGVDVNTYIPPQAFKYKESIRAELHMYFPDIPTYNYVPALAELESCISLRNSRCWSSTSQLLSKREQGLGIFQVTRAFKEDGSIRFDSLTGLRKKYISELKEASWSTFRDRPDLQIRVAILMLRDDYKKLYSVSDKNYRLQMTDASYNGGLGGLLKERRACGLSSNCNPNVWFNNVERVCLKSKRVIYGNRSPCDINRAHTNDIFKIKLPKYQKYYFNEGGQL